MQKKSLFLILLMLFVFSNLTANDKTPDFFITEEKEDRTKYTNEQAAVQNQKST